jgi:hypothetical protein
MKPQIHKYLALVAMKRFALFSSQILALLVFTSSSFATTLLDEDFVADDGGFVAANNGVEYPWIYNTDPGNWSIDGTDTSDNTYTSATLTSPTVTVPTSGSVIVDFEHLFSFEAAQDYYLDGGAVYVSINGGAFTKVALEDFTSNGYTSEIIDYGGGGILDGQWAFSGNSPDGGVSVAIPPAPAPPPPKIVVSTFELPLSAGDTFSVQFLGSWDHGVSSYPEYGLVPPNWLINHVSINVPDATGMVTVADGGTVATSDQSVVIDVAPNSVVGDTTIEIYQDLITNPDITVGNSGDFDTALAIYQFGPDGTTFDPEAFLTLTINVTALTELQRSLISVYRHEDTDNDEDIDEDDGFIMIEGTVCSIEENPVNTFTAICVAPIDHFSSYAIIMLNDSDGDGVDDSDDLCPDTSSGGFDADADGCMDTFAGLSDLIIALVDGGEVSPKMENSLLSKIENAEKSAGKNEVCESIDKLEGFIQQVSSQNGKKISSVAAVMLLDYANSLIAYLQALLESSVSCDI